MNFIIINIDASYCSSFDVWNHYHGPIIYIFIFPHGSFFFPFCLLSRVDQCSVSNHKQLASMNGNRPSCFSLKLWLFWAFWISLSTCGHVYPFFISLSIHIRIVLKTTAYCNWICGSFSCSRLFNNFAVAC